MKTNLIVALLLIVLFMGFNTVVHAQMGPTPEVEKKVDNRKVKEQKLTAASQPEQATMSLESKMKSVQVLFESKKYAKAISAMELIIKENPDNPQIVSMLEYNIACTYALLGKKEDAMNHLEKYVSTGIFDLDRMDKDVNLKAIRGMPKYSEICGKARKMVEDQEQILGKIPAPKSIFHRPKDVPENQETPLVIFLHGMGGCPANVGESIIPVTDSLKYSVLLPCGSIKIGMRPDGQPGYGWNFNTDLDAIGNEVKALKNINLKQVYISGFSAGASMAMIGGLKSPGLYSGVIAFSGMLQDDGPATKKITPASKRIPFYIIHGTADQVMPFQLAKNAEKLLQSKKYPVTLISFEGGHTLPQNYADIFKKAIDSFSGQKQDSGK